jgi:uncharacterized membrane protein YedE/YeeE
MQQHIQQHFIEWLVGLLFGVGLIVSGMTDPSKVIGFLNIAGRWDPSLALVMVGAIGVGLVAFGIAQQRSVSYLQQPMQWPTTQHIDRRLVIGATVFGVGWGLAGFCPAPAVLSLMMGQKQAGIFVLAMLAGMGLFEYFE